MTLATLMTETVGIYRYTTVTQDSTGDDVRVWTLLTSVDAFVARMDTSEEIVGRDQAVADWSFMLPAGTDVNPYDRIVHLGRTFEIVGLPASAVKPGAGEQFKVCKAKWVEG